MEAFLDVRNYPFFMEAAKDPLKVVPQMKAESLTVQELMVVEALFVVVIFVGFEFYNRVVIPFVGLIVRSRIPYHVKPLEKLSAVDRICIFLAKAVTALFVYHTYKFTVNTEVSRISLEFTPEALKNSLMWLPLHLPFLFLSYDFFYTLFHWALHWPPIYPLIHKHHHRQMSPFRGNDDAINDHPFEYISGEYLHLLSVFLLTRVVPANQVHAVTVVLFIFIGGTLASLNHTSINFIIPFKFNVNSHDYHHRQPRVNFGQYIMFWDWVFGTYQAEGTLPRDQKSRKNNVFFDAWAFKKYAWTGEKLTALS